MDKINHLKEKIAPFISHIPHSRTHPLKTFNAPQVNCRTKRDDELGFGISGTKLRKYTSLTPHLLKHQVRQAVVIGSAHSNHVLGFSQLLIENGIQPLLFLLGDPLTKRPKLQGNLLLTSLLVPEPQWHWISRKEWPQVETRAAEYIQANLLQAIIIPEGACMDEALPGALTFALDILQNEQIEQHQYQHLFMDAGTGLSAIATILAFAWLAKETMIHILLLADKEQQFLAKLKQFQISFERLMGTTLDWGNISMQFKLYQPAQARSFGSVNTAILNHIQFLAREEGFLTDPIYSAKLFLEAKNIIQTHALTGNILITHSGGALTLMGFQKQLENKLKDFSTYS